ncbi:Stress response protein [Dirofilaria immitis]
MKRFISVIKWAKYFRFISRKKIYYSKRERERKRRQIRSNQKKKAKKDLKKKRSTKMIRDIKNMSRSCCIIYSRLHYLLKI